MRTIRASEIGSFLYCARAWWYRLQGVEPENQRELSGGTEYHQAHGQQVLRTSLIRIAGWFLLLVALILLTIALTLLWLE